VPEEVQVAARAAVRVGVVEAVREADAGVARVAVSVEAVAVVRAVARVVDVVVVPEGIAYVRAAEKRPSTNGAFHAPR